MRDRLVELIGKELLDYASWNTEMTLAGNYNMPSVEEIIADKILDDGWIRKPCKVGQTVYVDCKTWRSAYLWVNYPHTFIKDKYYIVADVVAIVKTRKQTLVKLGTYNEATFTREYERYPISAIGKTVFLTREEAEQALVTDNNVGDKTEKGGEQA